MLKYLAGRIGWVVLPALFWLGACASAGAAEPRTYMMGSSPFFMTTSFFDTPLFENTDHKDILSLHADDFLGIPWDYFSGASPTLPPAWAAQWTQLAANAHATGKSIYLSLSPLEDRLRLARKVNANDTFTSNWGPVDSSGCYTFAADPNASFYQTAYVNYCAYLIDLVKPQFFSPALEINYTYTFASAQKAGLIAWYTGVHNALKQKYPDIAVFPTFTLEWLYGVGTNPGHGATPYADYLRQQLAVALSVPQDRTALSSYPIEWMKVEGVGIPPETYDIIASLSDKKIWITETGWQAARIPSVDDSPPGAYDPAYANETVQNIYLQWILEQAKTHDFEAVIWWLNRDYLDGPTAASQWMPAAGDAHTISLMQLWNALGGAPGVLALRLFANMGLYNFNGTPRPAVTTWDAAFAAGRPLSIATVFPTHVQAGATVSLTFTGEGILGAVRAKLIRPGLADIRAAGYTVFADTGVVCAFDLAGAAPGVWEAVVSLGAATASAPVFVTVASAGGDVPAVYAYPNPFRPGRGAAGITLTNRPGDAVIRVYTLSGELVRELPAPQAGRLVWDVRNTDGADLATGVYVFTVKDAGGTTSTGKIAIIR